MGKIRDYVRNRGVEANLEKIDKVEREFVGYMNNAFAFIDRNNDDQLRDVFLRLFSSVSAMSANVLTAAAHYSSDNGVPLSPEQKKALIERNFEILDRYVLTGLAKNHPDIDFGVIRKEVGQED